MKSHRAILSWFCLTIFLLDTVGCGAATDSYGRKVVGGIKLKEEESRGPLPNRTPRTIYLADFALEAETYSGDEGIRGALPGRLGQRIPHPLAKNNPYERVRQIVESMAKSLVQDLRAKGMIAQRLPNTAGNLPQKGLLVQGFFTERDEGNRLKRAAVGFGKGATIMDLQIAISDLAARILARRSRYLALPRTRTGFLEHW